ncbi:mitochondrial import inner membrane translocase subunit TIM16 [Drosophila takahashii]|uniref:mitochondrial import inner membrane translocase subunit TIM16 n=1 Tax=Drosophila takahashii TaxID=29030 RepID=UPI001CF7EDCB|nr:mitochondrial import inner membrane translocase subunit TIM16 [Drosophila takahashii]
MARYLAQIIILGAQVVGRALVKTLRQEMQAFEDAARMHETMSANLPSSSKAKVKGMTLVEAQQILNVKDLSDHQTIDSHYRHLFQANEKSSGGTFYLQSKVFRAKERIDDELARLEQLAKTKIDPPSPPASPSIDQSKEPGHQSR